MQKGLFLFCLLCAGISSFAQTTRTVCTSGCDFSTIQAAVNGASSGDVIFLNVNGTFTEKNITLPEKKLTIRGLGKTTTILQAAATRASVSGGRIFSYAAPSGGGSNSFTFEDMTIQNAYAPLASGQSLGSVFYASGALKGLTVTANNVKFYANETTDGNTVTSGGACFYISATGSGFTYNADLKINNCDFDDNRVGTSSGTAVSHGTCFNLGGNPARITINNSTFTNNNAYTGGGVIYAGANWIVNISNSSFDNNTARNGDGGCFNAKNGTWVLDNCLFKNNSAVFVSSVNANNGWGGVFIGKGGKIRNCTFYGNSAVKGGAICRTNVGTSEELQIINCTFYGNAASSTGKTIQYGSASSTTSYPLVMVNTIIEAGGGAAGSEIHFTLPYSRFTKNLSNYCNSISTEYATPGTTPTFTFNTGNSTLGLSTTLENKGGPTQVLPLTSGSSMIDAGTNAKGSTYDIPVKDQRNFSRTDGGIDVGAYEDNGVMDDAAVPDIVYTPLGNTNSVGDRTIMATITDVNGVYWYPQLTDMRPRIYFRNNNGTWFSAAGTLTSGNGLSGVWSFTISASAMGGLSDGDEIEYYIVAQDVSTDPSLSSSPDGVGGTSVNSITTMPTPNTYTIVGTLPVKLENFSASKAARDVQVAWTASNEINLNRYEIERSSDATTWSVVGQVKASNIRYYMFLDKEPGGKTLYYRLRSVDSDGTFSLSAVKQVRMEDPKGIAIYPNPVTANEFNISLGEPQVVRLFNSNGGLVWQKQLNAGTNKVRVDGLAKGVYQLQAEAQTYSVLIR